MNTLARRLRDLCFDDALTCGDYALVYAPIERGEGYATYTLYRGRERVQRWRVRRVAGLPCVQAKVCAALVEHGQVWRTRPHYGARFAFDDLGAPPRKVVSMAAFVRGAGEQMRLWAA